MSDLLHFSSTAADHHKPSGSKQVESDFAALLELYPGTTLDASTNQIALDSIGTKLQSFRRPAFAAEAYMIALDNTHMVYPRDSQQSLRALQVYAEALNMSERAGEASALLSAQKELTKPESGIDESSDIRDTTRMMRDIARIYDLPDRSGDE